MKIQLKNFEKILLDKNPDILKRGKDYFKSGLVKNFKEVKSYNFESIVLGAEDYEVFVSIDYDLNIINFSCDCPYDWGPICKHEVAVFFTIQEKFIKELIIEKEVETRKIKKYKKIKSISNIENKKLFFKSIIEDAINEISYNRGYVEWDMASDALVGAWKVLDYYKDYLEEKNYKNAIISLLILIETLIIKLEDVDDSAGEYSGFIEDLIFEHLPNLIEELKKQKDEKNIDFLLEEFFKLVVQESIYGYSFETEILENLILFIDKQNYKKFDKVLTKIKNNSDYGNFRIIEYKILKAAGESEKLEKFIKKNILDYGFCLFYSDILIKEKKLQEAEKNLLNLLKKQDYRKKDILEKLLEIAKNTDNLEKQKKYLFLIFVDNSNLENFCNYKKILGEEFLKNKEKFFQEFDKYKQIINYRDFPQICLENGQKERFLKYFDRNPYTSEVDKYFTKLLKLIPEKIYEIYKKEVESYLEPVGGRKVYKEQCRKIRKMKKIFPEKTEVFIEELKNKYKNRRALLEELSLV